MTPEILGQEMLSMTWILSWAVFFLVLWYLRSRNKQRKLELIHKERLHAIEKGVPLPELPGYEESRPGADQPGAMRVWISNPRFPLGAGALFIVTGFGAVIALKNSGDESLMRLGSLGYIVVFFGLGLMLMYWLMQGGRR